MYGFLDAFNSGLQSFNPQIQALLHGMCAKKLVVNPENGLFVQFLGVADQYLDKLA